MLNKSDIRDNNLMLARARNSAVSDLNAAPERMEQPRARSTLITRALQELNEGDKKRS